MTALRRLRPPRPAAHLGARLGARPGAWATALWAVALVLVTALPALAPAPGGGADAHRARLRAALVADGILAADALPQHARASARATAARATADDDGMCRSTSATVRPAEAPTAPVAGPVAPAVERYVPGPALAVPPPVACALAFAPAAVEGGRLVASDRFRPPRA